MYVSYYLTCSDRINHFNAKLEELEDALRDIGGHLFVFDDFNAEAREWGQPQTNSRGKRVLEIASRLHLVVLYDGTTTLRRAG